MALSKARNYLVSYQFGNKEKNGFGDIDIVAKSGNITKDDIPAIRNEIRKSLKPSFGSCNIIILNIMDLGTD